MKLREFTYCVDCNIPRAVCAYLQSVGVQHFLSESEVVSDASDDDVLALAHRKGAIVLTHDDDFGALVFCHDNPYTGLVFLRPGHLPETQTVSLMRSLIELEVDFVTPFVVVAEFAGDEIAIRIRRGAD